MATAKPTLKMSVDFTDSNGVVRVYRWAGGNYILGDCMRGPHAHVLTGVDVLVPTAGELRRYLRRQGFAEQTVNAAAKYLGRLQRN